jgi:PAS domain S-box-containing protein
LNPQSPDQPSGPSGSGVAGASADADDRDATGLVERESRWNYALVGSGLGVWDHNLSLGTRYYSDTWKAMRGMAPDEEADGDYDAWIALIHPDDREFVVKAIERQNAGDQNYQAFEYRERHKDGHWIWIECRGACVEWDAQGAPLRLVGTDTDITQRKEAEERLAHMSRRLDLALDISGIGVFESDLDAGTVEWDARLLAIYRVKDAADAAMTDAWTKRCIPTTWTA